MAMLRPNPRGDFPVVSESAFIDPTAILCGHPLKRWRGRDDRVAHVHCTSLDHSRSLRCWRRGIHRLQFRDLQLHGRTGLRGKA